MIPLRRSRNLIAFALIWMTGLWYFSGCDYGLFGYPDVSPAAPIPPSRDGEASPIKAQLHQDGKFHWLKLPDRYPVTSLRALPTNKPTTPIPKIQRSPAPVEDEAARTVREERLETVKDSFSHSWQGYKKYAWLHDEVKPLSGQKHDPFGGWAATLVDALDTLWIMGMKDDFEQAVRACEQIDFTTTETTKINVFETTIRYLGGFLAAYELSEKAHPTLLDKAVEVGELLMCAFDTPNRMPISRWSWKDYAEGNRQKAPSQVLVSEIGSLSLEFTKLSQLTGDMKYYDAVQRISDEFEKSQDATKLPGMWPIIINAAKLTFHADSGFTLGGMSDSLYEYFPKQYMLLGGAIEQPRKLYEGFIDVAKKHLFRRALNPSNIPLIISGEARTIKGMKNGEAITTVQYKPEGQHLTCFTGGMVGIASRIFDRPSDLDVAVQLTDACVWSYNSTDSGIGPEIWRFVPCGGIEESQMGENCTYSDAKWHAALREYWQPPTSGAPEGTEEELKKTAFEIQKIIESTRLPPGFVDVREKKYILRPEAIESVFILYRITGDTSWMEKAWEMFSAIEMHTRTGVAAASLDDVTKAKPAQVDSMESFWLAETLKYFYLVFSSWDTIDLDKWVLNTEAHPLRRPDA